MTVEDPDYKTSRDIPIEFFEELNAIMRKYIKPKGEKIYDGIERICADYLVSHGLRMEINPW